MNELPLTHKELNSFKHDVYLRKDLESLFNQARLAIDLAAENAFLTNRLKEAQEVMDLIRHESDNSALIEDLIYNFYHPVAKEALLDQGENKV